jgi:hypothetical protein
MKLRLDGTSGSKTGSRSSAGLIGTRPVILALKIPSAASENVPVIPVIAQAPGGSVRQGLLPGVPQAGLGSAGATFGVIVKAPEPLNGPPLN